MMPSVEAERPDLLELRGRELVDLDADGLGDAGVIHELVPAVGGARQADVGAAREADMLAGFLLELAVELDRIFVNLPDRIGHVEERQEARRVPGRAGGELLALDEERVGDALAARGGRASTRRRRRRRSPPRGHGISWVGKLRFRGGEGSSHNSGRISTRAGTGRRGAGGLRHGNVRQEAESEFSCQHFRRWRGSSTLGWQASSKAYTALSTVNAAAPVGPPLL